MAKVGIVLDKLYVDHDNGPGHPETYERILAIVDMLNYTKKTQQMEEPNVQPVCRVCTAFFTIV